MVEKLAAKELINKLNLLSIFEPKHREAKAKKVSPAPTVSMLFSLKAGQKVEDQSLQSIRKAPDLPCVTISLLNITFFLKLFAKLMMLEFLSPIS